MPLTLCDQIHSRALEAASRLKRAEADLIDILQQAEEHRIYIERGHSSLFQYLVTELGLGENTAYNLITVARKAREVPELKMQLRAGKMTLSNARRVAPMLSSESPESNAEWIEKGSTLSNRKLEREIVKVRPEAATVEKAAYVAEDRIRLELGLSEREMLKLRRVQDLLSQARRRPVSLEESIETLTSEYLKRHDPVEKAKRHQVRKGAPGMRGDGSDAGAEIQDAPTEVREPAQPSPTSIPSAPVGELVTLHAPNQKREPIHAATLHQVNLRDQCRCIHVLVDGTRCNQSRWIEIHHIIPVSQGGSNDLANLATLCSAHHRLQHLREPVAY